jgi:hypothetical protein
MTETPTWPDRATYRAMAQRPDAFFLDDELLSAEFAKDKINQPLLWSGARAMVFRATCGGRRVAVRFMLAEDRHAEQRYSALAQHLSTTSVAAMVSTEWLAEGVRLGSASFPVIKMDWVDGVPLDRHIRSVIDDPTAADSMGRLTAAWRECARSLVNAGIGHGDIHPGNLLVYVDEAGHYRLRLVDYDNVWVPGLDLKSREGGRPGFQHPHRPAELTGQYMDAFPNTLTYLSLRALAAAPTLWSRFGVADDSLLFSHTDLGDGSAEVWTTLAASPDPVVREITELTRRWLDSPFERYQSLDQVVAAAESGVGSGVGSSIPTTTPVHNIWPAGGQEPVTAGKWPPGGPPMGPLTWPPSGSGATAAPPPEPPGPPKRPAPPPIGPQRWGGPPVPPAPPPAPYSTPKKPPYVAVGIAAVVVIVILLIILLA